MYLSGRIGCGSALTHETDCDNRRLQVTSHVRSVAKVAGLKAGS